MTVTESPLGEPLGDRLGELGLWLVSALRSAGVSEDSVHAAASTTRRPATPVLMSLVIMVDPLIP